MNGFLKIEGVAAHVGLSKRTVYSLISDGSFPRPIQLSVRRVAWRLAEIDAWVDAKIAERDRISSPVIGLTMTASQQDSVQAAAEWLSRTSRSAIAGAIVPAIRDRFDLSALEACDAIRRANVIRFAAHRPVVGA